jgi:hypothetical protein
MDHVTAHGRFTGSRAAFARILLRGYVLMVPTIGIYRFWLVTQKRRYYWANTDIGGEPLEYSGRASQLLTGFLWAMAAFLPLYGAFVYLSTQPSERIVVGYVLIAGLIWFLMGYASYRGWDFRLSRTLWRGIRFDQQGSAWAYALRRLAWALAMVATAGLIYPFMATGLWRHRLNNTWYGDRQFRFAGRWTWIAGPYYGAYLISALAIVGALWVVGDTRAFVALSTREQPAVEAVFAVLGALLVVWVMRAGYRASELTKFWSGVSLGEARLAVRVGWWRLLALGLGFAITVTLAYLLLAIGGVIVMMTVAAPAFEGGTFDPTALGLLVQSSWLPVFALVFGYLLLLGAFSFLWELIIGYGFWRLMVRGIRVDCLEALDTVRARREDRSLVGEGLADALNVGAY